MAQILLASCSQNGRMCSHSKKLCWNRNVNWNRRPAAYWVWWPSFNHRPRVWASASANILQHDTESLPAAGLHSVTDPALRPCCEKKISLQGSIKCHISTVMHSREVKQQWNYLYKSLRHINHACDLRACQTDDCSPLRSAVKCHTWTLPAAGVNCCTVQ